MRLLLLLLISCLPCVGQLTVGSAGYSALLNKRAAGGGCATPNAPTGCGANSVTDTPRIDVTWTQPAGSYDGIEVWTSTDAGSYAYTTNADNAAIFVTIDNQQVGDGHVYIYKVRSTNSCGTQSAFSNTITNDIFVDATHYWTLNETSGNNRVDSIGGLTLTEFSGNVASAAGVHNNASDFRSDQTKSLQTASWNLIPECTIVFWFYLDSDTNGRIVAKDSGDGEWEFNVNDVCGVAMMAFEYGADGPSDYVPVGAFMSWHLIVGEILSDNSMLLSVDGSEFTPLSAAEPSNASGVLVVGRAFSMDTSPCMVDELSIWPRALSQAEVNSLAAGRFR